MPLEVNELTDMMKSVDALFAEYKQVKANGINPRERRQLLKHALTIVVKIIIDVID